MAKTDKVGIGQNVHVIKGGTCVAAEVTGIVRNSKTGENPNGKVQTTHGRSERSDDTYFERTYHLPESCKDPRNFTGDVDPDTLKVTDDNEFD